MERKRSPIPAKIGLCLAVFLSTACIGTIANAQAPAPAAPAPAQATPRTADGHPDLSGIWADNPRNSAIAGDLASVGAPAVEGVTSNAFAARDNTFQTFEEDAGLTAKANRNRPIYKPEFWQLVRDNDTWGNWVDPSMAKCRPLGIPRLGAPVQIVQLPDRVIFWHNDLFYGRNESRMIPTDGRPHNPEQVSVELYLGDSVGHWEGDTLVIETIGFTDESWIGQRGYPHGFQMKLTERVSRNGNKLSYQATVEDPEYLQEPWVLSPITETLVTKPNAFVAESLPCDTTEQAYIVLKTRH